MITRITGTVDSITDEHVIIDMQGIAYQVMVPAVIIRNIKDYIKNNVITLYTIFYIEGGLHGGNMFPRLIGFSSKLEREFFEKFTSVSGFGEKKALKAFIQSFGEIASAIENADKHILTGLPGIGGRSADKIIAELKGKMAKFADGLRDTGPVLVPDEKERIFNEAMEVLLQLDFSRREAESKLAEVFEFHKEEVNSTEEVITKVFKRQHNRK